MPRSLAGQMVLLLGLALLVAQIVNFALILNERQKLSLAQNQGPAIQRFVTLTTDLGQAAPEFEEAVLTDNSRRGAQFSIAPNAAVAVAGTRDARIEARLAQALVNSGIGAREVRAALTTERRAPRADGRPRGDVQILALAVRLDDGRWLNGKLTTPRPDPYLTLRLAAATLLLYLIVLGATVAIAVRIARPLGDLARAAEQFGGRGAPTIVTPRGPADMHRALEAFNAMNRRVVALLDEKDRMLGAIGHDLRTPLASLRIRAEGVEPEAEAQRMIETITEMTGILEDILVLARSGRAREAARSTDVSALVDAVCEDFVALGQDVAFEPGPRAVLAVQPGLLRRAVRNLVDNAVKYGGAARVAVRQDEQSVRIEVRDHGPGLAADQLACVLEPFYRGEQSRNRETGGTGLGLAIARAIADNHGGALRLSNAPGGGLLATLELSREA